MFDDYRGMTDDFFYVVESRRFSEVLYYGRTWGRVLMSRSGFVQYGGVETVTIRKFDFTKRGRDGFLTDFY